MKKSYETEHYIFYFNEGSEADKDILKIAAEQEEVFERITSVLHVTIPMKIIYNLCQTPEEVGEFYGSNEPCNGFAHYPDTIYAVYNEKIKCIGPHEDTHLIAGQINWPDCVFLMEGLAMKADEVWWGIQNVLWCKYFLEQNLYMSIKDLFDNDFFYSYGDEITYPIAGAFVEWFFEAYSQDTFIRLYKAENNYVQELEKLVCKSIQEIEEEFLLYVNSKSLSDEVRKEIEIERST